ncbi:MAG: zinc-ribbon domain-containing protein [Hyphomicrobiaceae bacterium]|nr:zinc-ribbon domain-containing protein [Hyphomicrobiaceae bacterium]
MRIICPNCNAVYQVGETALGPNGRTVRCAKCKESWFATAEPEEDAFAVDDFEAMAASGAADAAYEADAEVADPDGAGGGYEAFEIKRPDPVASTVSLIEGALGRHREEGGGTVRPRPAVSRGVRLKQAARRNLIGAKSIPALVVLGLVLIGAMVLLRNQVVSVVPDLASLYRLAGLEVNVRGLQFTEVTTQAQVSNGQRVLLIEGAIENVDTAVRDVPAIRLAMLSAQGSEVYVWLAEPAARLIDPGSRIPFRTQVVAPPALARDLSLRFVDRRGSTRAAE